MQLLHVDSSILSDNSVSRTLTADIVAAEKALVPGIKVVYRDLATNPLPHLTGELLAAVRGMVTDLPPAIEHELAQSAAALEEFLASDVIVIGAPMYNFSIPSQLKSWIDRLSVAGKTFKYDEKGVRGLAGGKKVIIASSRGGRYGAETPMGPFDHQETYLRSVFQFFGITDITFIRAEGVNMGGDVRSQSIKDAQSAIAQLV